MKERTKWWIDFYLLLAMPAIGGIAVGAYFVTGSYDLTALIMLVGFWPVFLLRILLSWYWRRN
jgi:hypothetical protein